MAKPIETNIVTFKYRLRSKHNRDLNKKARAVNTVWNFCNATQQEAVRRHSLWTNFFQLSALLAGTSKVLGISANTAIACARAYDNSRRQQKKVWLKYRSWKMLGWVPFKKGKVRLDGNAFRYFGKTYYPTGWREIPEKAELCSGSFNQDASGNWYINIVLKFPANDNTNYSKAVGVDLGLKELAVTSDGNRIKAPKFYRKSELSIATAQRARKTKRARAIHRKVANRRKDFLHKQANKLVREYGTIIVGDVSPSKLTQTKMAKSVNDASWATFKNMLRYKSVMNGGRMIEVNEAYTTQTCSECGTLPASRPRGIAALGVRQWTCSDCGAVHDRDQNAAKNIARVGLDKLAAGAAA